MSKSTLRPDDLARFRSRAAALVLVAFLACTRSRPPRPAVGHDLRALQWIVGTWRGTGDQQAPFYERYRLTDDSTLVVETLGDSTVATVTETTRFRLRGGALASAPGESGEPTAATPRWRASVLTPDSVRFEPLTNVRNTFVWRRGSTPDTWTAVLSWPASATRPARTVTYTMRRWP